MCRGWNQFGLTWHASLPQEAKLSQEQLADQVVKTSEEKYNLLKELDTAKKVGVCVLGVY